MNITSQQYDSVIAICRALFINKMKDYGSAWRILRLPSLTDQIFIKAQRIRSLQENEVRKVDEDETGEFIGWTGIKFVNDLVENGNTNFYDYGYRLNENFWNKGYATEASIAWLEYGFNQMKIDKMNAYTHAQNGASNHILQKVGMRFMEDYLDKDGVQWKWWQMENNNL